MYVTRSSGSFFKVHCVCDLQDREVMVLLFWPLLQRNFSGHAFLEGSVEGTWKICLFEVALNPLWSVCLCPALGAAEHRPATVHSLSPACIRHPSCAGTDPDACHQCSAGMCPRDAGFDLGTSRSWLPYYSPFHLIPQQEPPPYLHIYSTSMVEFHGELHSKCVSYHLVLKCKAGKSQVYLKKAWCTCMQVSPEVFWQIASLSGCYQL